MLKKIIFLLIFSCVSSFLSASKWSERAFDMLEDCTAKELRRAIETDYSFVNYTQGVEKKNILMGALESEREIDIINVLLRAGISPDSKDANKKTALMYACENTSDLNIIKKLIENNAPFKFQRKNRVLRKDKAGKTCFDYAKKNPDSAAVINLLSMYANPDFSPEVNEPENQELSPVEDVPPAEEESLPSELETEIDSPLSEDSVPDEVPETEETVPSVEEPQNEDTTEKINAEEVVKEVKEPEIDIRVNDEKLLKQDEPESFESPVNELFELDKKVGPGVFLDSIHLYDYAEDKLPDNNIPASDIKKFPVEFTFIEKPNERNANGLTLLMEAVKAGNVKAMTDLIMSGADINAIDKEGWTALMFAVRFQKNPEVTRTLLSFGASSIIKNKYGISALQLAAGYSDNPEVIDLIIKPFKPESEEFRSAFVYGIKNSNKAKNLKPFIDRNIQMNVPYKGKTYLMYACESNRNTDIIKLLLKAGASKYQLEANTNKSAFDYAKENSNLKHDSIYWSLNIK